MAGLELVWETCNDAPTTMFRGAGVAHGSVAYFRPFNSGHVYAYDMGNGDWSMLPPCPLYDFGLVVVEGMVTAVGGRYEGSEEGTNLLYSFTGGKWESKFPTMPTKRMAMALAYTKNSLIAAGGRTRYGGDILRTVEVLKTENLKPTWYIANSLPVPATRMKALVCGEQLYLLGAMDKSGEPIRYTLTCSVQSLLESCERNEGNIWKQVADVPLYKTSCTTLRGKAITVGGKHIDDSYSASIYAYNPEKNQWVVIGCMPTARSLCLVTTVEDNKVVAVGGWPTARKKCSLVQVGSLADSSSQKIASKGDTPKMWQLQSLSGGDGKTVQVIKTVAANWEQLAAALHFGGEVTTAVRRNEHFQVEAACRAILQRWLEGEGRKPVTWATILECLEDIEYNVLRDDLDSLLV